MATLSRREFIRNASTAALAMGGISLPAQSDASEEMRLRWNWRLRIDGLVARPAIQSLEDIFRYLPSRLATLAFVEEGGTEVVTRWQGLHLSTLHGLVQPLPGARWVHVHCIDGHREVFPIGELLRPRALLAHTANERLLDGPEGGPLRLVLPWRSAAHSLGAVERLEFSASPDTQSDDHQSLLPGGERTLRGWQPNPVGIPSLPRAQAPLELRGRWQTIPNPSSGDWMPELPLALLQLGSSSFNLANAVRTRLIMQGETVLPAMMPAESSSPIHAGSEFTRLCVVNIAGEIDHPDADAIAIHCLRDPSPQVAAMALDTCARRGLTAGLEWAERGLNSPDPGLAATALTTLARLCAQGDPRPVEAARRLLDRPASIRAEALRILAERS